MKNLKKSYNSMKLSSIEEQIVNVLQTIFDPEIPVDIYNLGLIYKIDVDDHTNVKIRMTLTAPNCPLAETLPVEVKAKVAAIPNIKSVKLEVAFDPPWTKDMMSESAKFELGMF